MTDVVEAEFVVLPDPQVNTDELPSSAAVQQPSPSVDTRTIYFVWRARWTGAQTLVGVFADETVAGDVAAAHDYSRVETRTTLTDLMGC